MTRASPRLWALLWVTVLVLAASLLTVLARPTLQRVAPFTFVWLQIGFGALFLGGFSALRGGLRVPRGLSRKQWICIVAMGVCNFALTRLLFMLCLQRVPAPTHAYLTSFVGVLTLFLSAVWLKERAGPLQLCAAAVALGGTQLYFLEAPAPAELAGLGFGAVGVLTLAITNVCARQLSLLPGPRVPSLFAGWFSLLIGGLPLLVYGLVSEGLPAAVSLRDWVVIAGFGLVGIALATTVWVHVLRVLRSYEASLLAGTSLIYTTLLAIPLLGEVPASHQYWGMLCMLVGLVGVQIRR